MTLTPLIFMVKLRFILFVSTLSILSGCGDFHRPLGDGYVYLRTNYSNHTIFYATKDDGSLVQDHEVYSLFPSFVNAELIIDSNVIKIKVVNKYILAYRIETDFYDRSGSPPPGYGYYIIDKQSHEVMRVLPFEQAVEYLGSKGLKLPYSLCRAERKIIECLKNSFIKSG